MSLRQLVKRAPITIDSSATLYDVIKIMAEQNIGFIVVLENGRMVGVLSERDVVRTLAERRDFDVKVGEICKRDIITLSANASVEDAAEEMGRHRIRHIVVVENAGKLVGVVSARDVLQELYAQETGAD